MFEGSSRVLENGSLIFERVAKDSEGHYLCEARNDIGAGLSKLIFLKVNGKPNLIMPKFYVRSLEIGTFNLLISGRTFVNWGSLEVQVGFE